MTQRVTQKSNIKILGDLSERETKIYYIRQKSNLIGDLKSDPKI